MSYLEEARKAALNSRCKRARCGSVVVKDGKIIGRGWNSPARNLESQRRCEFSKESLHRKVTDKTCCIHAEQRAIVDAIKNVGDIAGSSLYFARVNEDGTMQASGKPYCTICSKFALDNGVKEWILLHEDGAKTYGAEEYNLESYKYTD